MKICPVVSVFTGCFNDIYLKIKVVLISSIAPRVNAVYLYKVERLPLHDEADFAVLF